MAEIRFRKRSRSAPRINITPLIDVVLLLLIFIMLSSSFILQPGINVNLPESQINEVPTATKELIVTITPEKNFYLQGQPITIEALPESLAEHVRDQGHHTLKIASDELVPIKLVVQVWDIAQQVGLKNATILTRKPEE